MARRSWDCRQTSQNRRRHPTLTFTTTAPLGGRWKTCQVNLPTPGAAVKNGMNPSKVFAIVKPLLTSVSGRFRR
jgi:hypothetical protein